MVDWRKRTVQSGDVTLAVFELGDEGAPPVMLVHGWPDTHHLWDQVAPALAKEFHVIAHDNRGAGESSRPGGVAGYHIAELADDLLTVADEVSPERPVHIVGHDWGSVLTWEAVSRHGAEKRIASFVSVSGPSLDQLGAWARENLSRPTPRRVATSLSQIASSAYTAFFHLPVAPRILLSFLGIPAVWRNFLKVTEGTPADRVSIAPTLRRDMISGVALYRANIVPHLSHPEPHPTTVPVLELVNHRDVALRPAIFEHTHRYVQRLWRRDTPTGHWLPHTHPEYLTEAARAFIGYQETGSLEKPAWSERTRLIGPPQAFSGRLAVVTGAGSGIGRETAYALAELGCEIVAADIDAVAAEETARECRAKTVPATAYALDVADSAGFAEFANTVQRDHGVPDIVVNNAGVGLAGGVLDATDEQIDRLLDINLRGVITGSRLFGRQMVERDLGGQIVNLASAAAFTPQRDLGVYSASKAGVLLFSESLRAELADHHIGVTAICPGIVDTAIVANTPIAGLGSDEQAARDRLVRFYQRRGFTPDKVARQIVAAIRSDKAVVPVTPEASVGYRIYRFAPWLSRQAARRRVAAPVPTRR
ncbi:SDR family oxidoreductase [Gordonia soli]|uniref:Peptidase S33 family protein n=1 Tax=Gordonia soli NBRC 108243 TaxID=1223545 RepID=M0QFZ0_9ACTN|nr:SDR family oxidoreductase [Gordonia soli]GAC67488.1 peptidase S33 family protein [Gordonia soli NBRC 108243]